jgi:hypothetical protein
MKSDKSVVWCAIALFGIALADLVFSRLMGTTQSLPVQLVRLTFTGLLAYFLAQGKNWARWLSVVLLGIGSAIAVVSFATLFGRYFSVNPVRMMWLLGNGLAFGALGAFLALSRQVARECSADPAIAARET